LFFLCVQVDVKLTQITLACDGVDGLSGEEDGSQQSNIWGRFLSINKLFPSVNLIEDEYSLGRGKKCSISFDSKEIQASKYFLAYSAIHFKIVRDLVKNYVYLQDLSSNGTYVNGEKVGKNKRHVLDNNAEIALASKTNRVYVYIDTNATEDSSIPANVREKYIVSKEIGRGAYGEVKLCFIRGTCDRFAMKIIQKKHFTLIGAQAHTFNQQIQSECSILRGLDHPCIIRVYDVYDTPNAVYIILELVEGGELFDRVVANGQFDEKTTKFLFRQMCLGVKYLHDCSITHRDLKPENVLLTLPDTNETLIKITDFGLSRFINETTLMKTFCGTPNYLAPEVLATRGEASYTNKVDVWSLGVILYICLVGYPPFSESVSGTSLNDQIIQGLYTFADEFWSEVSESVKDLIRKMMCIDPAKRLTMAGVLEHPWLADDLENTERVNKIMYPSTIISTPPTIKTSKRAACDDETSTKETRTKSTDEKPSESNYASGRPKRVKH
jgi:serine/threonine-protein kinase Chk2